MSDDQSKPFDVFLSHAHVDAEVVEKLGARLEDEGKLHVWLDKWVLVPGEQWQQGLAKGLDGVSSCAVCIGRKTPTGWFNQEIQRALNRQARDPNFRVIPVILPDGDQSLVDNFLELRTWVQFKGNIDDADALHRLISGIKRISPGRPHTPSAKPPTLFTVPLPPNPFFTGRENVLEELKKTLEKSGISALTGLGGMGKTQTAAHYAHQHRQDYPWVLWLRTESAESLFSDLTQLAGRLALPEREAKEQSVIVDAVLRWLDEQERWLLVLDNVEDYAVIRELARKASPGGRHVVITTQIQALAAIGRQRLFPLEQQQGAALLLRRAHRLAAEAPLSYADASEAALAREISQEVGGLPLALDQAGAYLEETGSGLHDYLTLLRQRFNQLAERRGGLDSDHLSVAATFLMSFEKLASQNPAAAELLRAAAFLVPDAMPEEIFNEGAAKFGPLLQEAASDPLKWDEAIGSAFKFSLLERDTAKKTLAVHRMVQAVVRSRMSAEERPQWAEQVVRAVNAAFPYVEFAVWHKCERLVPSAQHCAALIGEYRVESPEGSRLLNQAGYYLDERARYAEAELLHRQALGISKKLGPELDVAISLNNLAVLLQRTNRLGEAEPLTRQALEIDERVYGRDHPNVARDLNNLAMLLRATNRLDEAEPLYRRALDINECSYGPDHSKVATSLSNLAVLLQDTKRLDEAEPLARRALAIDEKVLGSDHPSVAIRLNVLYILLRATNRLEEGEPLIRRAISIGERSYGPDHPELAVWLNNLALLLKDTNRLEEAEPLMRRALAIDERSHGCDHPSAAIRLNNLALLLKATNRLGEAGPLMQRALAILEKSLGHDHPSTVIVRENLAALLRDMGKVEEAAKL